MAIDIRETLHRYRYLGIELPAPPGMTPEQVRDLHSTLYPELVSADIEVGEIVGGVREVTFRRAVGTKGSRLQRLRETVASAVQSPEEACAGLAIALKVEEVKLCSSIWERSAQCARRENGRAVHRVIPAWQQLPPIA
jgi:PRTRC genetic system protein C